MQELDADAVLALARERGHDWIDRETAARIATGASAAIRAVLDTEAGVRKRARRRDHRRVRSAPRHLSEFAPDADETVPRSPRASSVRELGRDPAALPSEAPGVNAFVERCRRALAAARAATSRATG